MRKIIAVAVAGALALCITGCASGTNDAKSFSRDGLIEQLEYEGFTPDQATYGVDSVGL